MRKSFSIASITLTQGIRNNTFWIAALLFFSLILVSFFLKVLAIGHKAVMLRNFGLSAMEISALVLVVYGFVFSLFRDKENRIQSVYLTYVPSSSYLSGKLFGHSILVFIYLSIASILCSALLIYENAFNWIFFFGVYSIYLKLSIVCSFCLLFASLFSSPVFASLMSFFTYLASELSAYPLLLMKTSSNALILGFYRVLYHLLPNFDKIDLKYQSIWDQTIPYSYLVESSVYALVYSYLVYRLSLFFFANREV